MIFFYLWQWHLPSICLFKLHLLDNMLVVNCLVTCSCCFCYKISLHFSSPCQRSCQLFFHHFGSAICCALTFHILISSLLWPNIIKCLQTLRSDKFMVSFYIEDFHFCCCRIMELCLQKKKKIFFKCQTTT
jgi:hypothetical protein